MSSSLDKVFGRDAPYVDACTTKRAGLDNGDPAAHSDSLDGSGHASTTAADDQQVEVCLIRIDRCRPWCCRQTFWRHRTRLTRRPASHHCSSIARALDGADKRLCCHRLGHVHVRRARAIINMGGADAGQLPQAPE